MKKVTWATVIAGVAATGMLTVGATTFAASGTPAPSSHTQKADAHQATWHRSKAMRHRGTITALTATTVTVRYHHGKHTHTFNLDQVTVRALAYPVSSSLLQVGSPVAAFQNHIVMLPIAAGTLHTTTNGGWSLATSKKGTLSLSSTPSTLLGLPGLSSGAKVMAFGKISGATLTPAALAAPPTRVRATVVSNQNGILTVKTSTTASLALTEAKLPMTKWLGKLKSGRQVVLLLDPVNKTPLAVLPKPHRPRQGLARFAVGKLTSVSTSSLVVTNPLGTETISLSGRSVKVFWAHHPGATMTQVPSGTPVMVHETGKTSLVVRVF